MAKTHTKYIHIYERKKKRIKYIYKKRRKTPKTIKKKAAKQNIHGENN
tara:strand:+ start:119 stop:262 length:144 start_codon:yes stop_codon:yes gene_type:complete